MISGAYLKIVAPMRKIMTGYLKLVLSFYQAQNPEPYTTHPKPSTLKPKP